MNRDQAISSLNEPENGEPMTTIEITKEQAEALTRGESITITPIPKSALWNPKGGQWYVNSSGEAITPSSSTSFRNLGIERATEEKAIYAAEQMRAHNRLLAYVAENDNMVLDWSNRQQHKYTIDYDIEVKEYNFAFSARRTEGAVYMSKECATTLCKKLNSREIVL